MARDFDLAKLLTDNGLRTTVDVDVSFDSGTLFVDADTNRVGIATTTPSYNLEVNGSLNSTSLYIGGTQVTSTAIELNLLDGVTATTAEINYLDGVTSNIQTQIDNISSSFTISDNQGTPNTDTVTTGQTLTFAGSTGIDTTVSDNQVSIAIDSTVATLTGSQTLTNKTITSPSISDPTLTGTTTYATLNDGTTSLTATVAELNYTDGVTSNIQTQLDAKIEGNQTITLSGDVSGSGTTSISVTVTDDSHNHIISNVDGLQTALDLKAPLASPALTGTATAVNLTVSGNLTVNGTTFTNNADNLLVDDALIELNHSLTGTNASDLGIVMERGTTGDNAFMGWDESADRFILGTTTATGASTGDLTITASDLNVAALITEGPDSGGYVGYWPPNSGYVMFGTAGMTGNEYSLITDGTNTFLGSGAGGLTYIRGPSNDSSPQLVINGSSAYFEGGNVGIGTTSPASTSMLHLYSAGDARLQITADSGNTDETANPSLFLQQDGTFVEAIFGINGNANDIMTGAAANEIVIGHYENASAAAGISFGTRGVSTANGGGTKPTVRMRIVGDGKVGIGTTSPTQALDVSGNIAVSGTVDGRDIATDGTKLDGIESGATADQTASEILTAIKTVDGSGSGLDADFLDGQQGSYYLAASSYTAADVLTKIKTVDGAGSGLDADTVDGQHAYEMSWGHDNTHGTWSNFNSFINTANFGAHFIQGSTNGPGQSGATQYFHQRMSIGSNYNNYSMQLAIPRNRSDSYLWYRNEEAGSASSWYKIRAGYADNADTLDGQQGSYYLDYNNLTNKPSSGLATNSTTISSAITLSSGTNGMVTGPVTISATITIPTGSGFTVV